jgi:DNA repair photolyase
MAVLPEMFLVSFCRSLALYRDCAHCCRYCDGNAKKHYVEGDFERDIVGSPESSRILCVRRRLQYIVARKGTLCIGSGVTDVYQPIERLNSLLKNSRYQQ